MQRFLKRTVGHLRPRRRSIAAAAQHLQNILDAHLAHAAGADDGSIAVGEEDEGRLCTRNIKQLIRRLRGDDPADGLLRCGDGDIAVDHLGAADHVIFGNGVLQIVLEQLFHLCGVCAPPPEEGRRLKGAPAGAKGKALGVQNDARQKRLGLQTQQIGRLDEVLNHLRHQFAGRGGVGLVEVQRSVRDIVRRPQVMVDDRHFGAGVQQITGDDLIRPVGVHHHQKGLVVQLQYGVLMADKPALVLRQGGNFFRHDSAGIAVLLLDDIGRHAPLPGNGADADGCAHGVQIRHPVSHDKDGGGGLDQLAQCVGHDPALDLGVPLRLLGTAAVKLKVKPVFDHRLVAAPGEGHLYGKACKVHHVPEAGVHADADGEGGADAVGADDLVDGVYNGELALAELVQILLLKDAEIPIPVIPGEQPPRRLEPGSDLVLHRGPEAAAGLVVGVADQILIVVDEENGHHRACGKEPLPDLGKAGDVHPVSGGEQAVFFLSRSHSGHMAEDHVVSAIQFIFVGTFRLTVQQPLGGKLGNSGVDLGIKQVLPVAGNVQKTFV